MERYIMQPAMDIVQRLETYRLEHKISQEDLSEKLGVAFSTVNRWLNKKSKPNKIQYYHIEKLLKTSKQETHL
jgi:transcriptional regulator with XRE-family HTH domain